MLSRSQNLLSVLAVLTTGLLYSADPPVAQAGITNLSRVGVPTVKALAPESSARVADDLPYTVSRNEDHETPEAVVNWNRECCADLDTASFVFAAIEIGPGESWSPSQRLDMSRATLLAAHVLLRI